MKIASDGTINELADKKAPVSRKSETAGDAPGTAGTSGLSRNSAPVDTVQLDMAAMNRLSSSNTLESFDDARSILRDVSRGISEEAGVGSLIGSNLNKNSVYRLIQD